MSLEYKSTDDTQAMFNAFIERCKEIDPILGKFVEDNFSLLLSLGSESSSASDRRDIAIKGIQAIRDELNKAEE